MISKWPIRIIAIILAILFVLTIFISAFPKADGKNGINSSEKKSGNASFSQGDSVLYYDCSPEQTKNWTINNSPDRNNLIFHPDAKNSEQYANSLQFKSIAGEDGIASLNTEFNGIISNGTESVFELDIRSLAEAESSGEQGLWIELSYEDGSYLKARINSHVPDDDHTENALISFFDRENKKSIKYFNMPSDNASHYFRFVITSDGILNFLIDHSKTATVKDLSIIGDKPESSHIHISSVLSKNSEIPINGYICSINVSNNVVINSLTLDTDISKSKLSGQIITSANPDSYTAQICIYDYTDPEIFVTENLELTESAQSFCFADNSFPNRCHIIISLIKDDVVFSAFETYTYIYDEYIVLEADDEIESEAGKVFCLNDLEKLNADTKSGWVLSYYSMKNGAGSGNVLNCAPQKKEATKLNIPIKITGTFAVYVGYITGTSGINVSGHTLEIDNSTVNSFNSLREAFVYADDFSDESIYIQNVPDKLIKIAYLKFVSISDDDLKCYFESLKEQNLMVEIDGFKDFCTERIDTKEALTDISVTSLENISPSSINYSPFLTTQMSYKSDTLKNIIDSKLDKLKVPESKRPDSIFDVVDSKGNPVDYEEYMTDEYKFARDQMRSIAKTGESPHEIIADAAEKANTDLYVSLRMSSFFDPKSQYFLNGSLFYLYPEWHQKNADLMSFYYEGYRQYIIDLLCEFCKSDTVDGVTLDFSRYPYLIGSEQNDVSEKTKIINQFLIKLREELPKDKMIIAKLALPVDDYSYPYGIDWKSIVNSKLINRLITVDFGEATDYDASTYAEYCKKFEIEYYAGINTESQKQYADTYDRVFAYLGLSSDEGLSPEECLLRARKIYKSGAGGLLLSGHLKRNANGRADTDYKYLAGKDSTEVYFRMILPTLFNNNPIFILEKSAEEINDKTTSVTTSVKKSNERPNESGSVIAVAFIISIILITVITLGFSRRFTGKKARNPVSKSLIIPNTDDHKNTSQIELDIYNDDFPESVEDEPSEEINHIEEDTK